ncbi:MAG: nuclease-related domain-containing protein [Chloroflexota bacterium]
MRIVTNEKYVASRKRLGSIFSFLGIGVLLGGFILTFTAEEGSQLSYLSLFSLPIGWVLSQVGLFFANRLIKKPVIHEAIDEGLRKVGKYGEDSHLYHYVFPVNHMVLTPYGIIALIAKHQSGKVTADGVSWKQKIGFFQRFFGQQTLGNPALEAENAVKQIAKWISHNVPDLAETELPIGAAIVFTANDVELDVHGSDIPAVHHTKLKGFWKQRQQDTPMDDGAYNMLLEAFDGEADGKGALDLDDEE